jgi:hypothetical protein
LEPPSREQVQAAQDIFRERDLPVL